jgi:pyrroline-5-carboxylate reductase
MIAASTGLGAALTRHAQILVIGFGNMGQALVRGWLARGHVAGAIQVVDPVAAARESAAAIGVAAVERIGAAHGAKPEVVVLAVKPNQVAGVLGDCRGFAGAEAVFLSIAAGKTIGQLADGLGTKAPIVRAMPNTPAAIGKGMTVLVASPNVSPAQRELCGALLRAVGEIAWLDDERDMDAVTAVSGSGPAYVFLLIECLERAAVEAGLSPGLARQLSLATVAGAGAYAEAAGEPPSELRRRVTSPGGTTQAALAVLGSEHGLAELVARAVQAAAKRSRELSTD